MVTDLACESEALRLKVEEEKRQHEVEEVRVQAEEARAKAARDAGGCPKKQVCANTAGSSYAEASTLGAWKVLKVCLYCTKRGEFCLLPISLFSLVGLLIALPRSAMQDAGWQLLLQCVSQSEAAV